MNRNIYGPNAPVSRRPRQGYSTALAATLLAVGALSVAGCGEKPFAKVNGKVVTMEEYVKALERQQVSVPGGATTNAERLVIDQLIGNKIILDEASKENALPSDADVTSYYEFQKRLFEQRVPGKSFETVMKEQGSSPEEVKNEIKVQLAETNVYVKKLKISDDDVRKAFESFKGQYLPARVQLRLIVVQPGSPDFAEAKKQLDAKTPFDEVAKKVNLVNLKPTGGLLPQPTPVSQINAKYQNDVAKTNDGGFFGPVDFDVQVGQPPAKAWIKVEKKLPAFTVSYEEARPDVLRQVVQAKVQDPANANARKEIMRMKVNANFEPSNPAYNEVWGAVKKQASDAGLFEDAPTAPAPASAGGNVPPIPAAGGPPPGPATGGKAPAGGAAPVKKP